MEESENSFYENASRTTFASGFNLFLLNEIIHFGSVPASMLLIKHKTMSGVEMHLRLVAFGHTGPIFSMTYYEDDKAMFSLEHTTLMEIIMAMRHIDGRGVHDVEGLNYDKLTFVDTPESAIEYVDELFEKHKSLFTFPNFTVHMKFDVRDIVMFLLSKKHNSKAFLLFQAGIRSVDASVVQHVLSNKDDLDVYDQVVYNLITGALEASDVAAVTAKAMMLLKMNVTWQEVFQFSNEEVV